jgi:hypothetical protein
MNHVNRLFKFLHKDYYFVLYCISDEMTSTDTPLIHKIKTIVLYNGEVESLKNELDWWFYNIEHGLGSEWEEIPLV